MIEQLSSLDWGTIGIAAAAALAPLVVAFLAGFWIGRRGASLRAAKTVKSGLIAIANALEEKSR